MSSNNLSFSNNQNNIRVVILEDDDPTRRGMVAMLADEGINVIGDSADPGEVILYVKEHHPDVAFIDLRIWEDDQVGVKTIIEINELSPETKCIVRTAYPSVKGLLAAMTAGAKGFVKKGGLRGTQLSLGRLARIVVDGGTVYEEQYFSKIVEYIKGMRKESLEDIEKYLDKSDITKQEQRVLSLMAQGKTNDQIASELGISVNTVKAHSHNIFEKLNVKNRDQAIIVGRDLGLIK